MANLLRSIMGTTNSTVVLVNFSELDPQGTNSGHTPDPQPPTATNADFSAQGPKDANANHTPGPHTTTATKTDPVPTFSFDDNSHIELGTLVFADIPPPNFPLPFYPCATATPQTIKTIKSECKKLCRYVESDGIARALRVRIQVMANEAKKNGSGEPLTLQAKKLKGWLERIAIGRVQTGEAEGLIRHEREWAAWWVRAIQAGVVHVKREGCVCGVDWEVE